MILHCKQHIFFSLYYFFSFFFLFHFLFFSFSLSLLFFSIIEWYCKSLYDDFIEWFPSNFLKFHYPKEFFLNYIAIRWKKEWWGTRAHWFDVSLCKKHVLSLYWSVVWKGRRACIPRLLAYLCGYIIPHTKWCTCSISIWEYHIGILYNLLKNSRTEVIKECLITKSTSSY